MVIFKKGVIIWFLVIFYLIVPLNVNSAVLINEILANGVKEPDSEWVELFNNDSSEVNLTNWNVSESFSRNFTLNTTIPANGFIVLVENFTLFNSTFPNVNQSGIKVIGYGEIVPNFELSNSGGTVVLYNSSGNKVDSIDYAQSSTTQENISIGRYPDGSSKTFNLSTLTPGAKNDNQAPRLNKWVNPFRNNTNISGLTNIIVNITDDTTQVNSTFVNFNGTNLSMTKNNDLWTFLWNTSLNAQKQYNITVFFNDSYGKKGSDTLFNILVNNSPRIDSFSPTSLTQTLAENSTLNFNVNASDPDDSLSFSWFIDNTLNSTNPSNFSYTPGFNDNGTHTINVTVKDSTNQVSIKWTITVTNLNRAPTLDSISNKLFSKNINSSFNITASDLDNGTLTFSSNHSSIAISKINNSLATVSWKPTNKDLGNNIINFTVSDGLAIDSKVVAIVVNFTINNAPEIISSPITTATKNEKYTYDVDATDSDNDTLSFSLKTNASGMSIDSSNGLITFTPFSLGFFAVNVSVKDFIEIINQSFNITVLPGSRLKITDVDVKIDGKKSSNVRENSKISKEAKPSSDVEFKVTVKNDFSKSENVKIENIEVKVTIEDIDNGEDLEEESKEFDLRVENDKPVTLKFKLPLNVDEDEFNVLIEAEGEDENGNVYEQDFEVEIEVEKDKHDIRFLSFDLSPLIVSCNRIININYKIINVGQEDEENAIFELKNDDLGIDFVQKGISINEGTEDNTFPQSANIKISDEAENNGYSITANLYADNGKLSDTKTAEINIVDCIKTIASRDEVVLLVGQSKEQKTETIREPIKTTTTKISSQEVDSNMHLLLLSTFIFTMFFMFTAIILFVKF